MSRPTNNYERKHIDFLSTIAEIGEPFNSSLLEKYPEYKSDISAYLADEKESFLSILNKIGEDGCQVLTDQVVNYIDDISNIDTTIPSALLSQAESLGYPYKDKKYVEQLSRLSKCSPFLQSLVWAVSTKASNSKTILNRLNILDDERFTELSSVCNTDELNDEISSDIYDMFSPEISSSIFGRRYLYLERTDDGVKVSSNKAPSLLDFSWMANAIFAENLISYISEEEGKNYLSQYDSYVVNFGKYNFTLFAIVCYTYLYSQLFTTTSTDSSKAEQINRLNLTIEQWNKYAKQIMPFLFDNNLFDPLQAAWSIIFDGKTINDFEENYHAVILDFIKAFNEKLNTVSYDTVIDFIKDQNDYSHIPLAENLTFVFKLNANSFSYQQLMIEIIKDVKSVFGLEIENYIKSSSTNEEPLDEIFGPNYFLEFQSKNGFSPLNKLKRLTDLIDWNGYISDIISNIFKLGKNIKTLREDLRIMTLRNSYKGTTALIQFSVIEYLKECIEDLISQSFSQYNNDKSQNDKIQLPLELVENIKNNINEAQQDSVAVSEYWDYTEYFNRVDNQDEDDGHRVDWFLYDKYKNDSLDFAHKYGTMDENEILDFYANVLNLPKDIYFKQSIEDAKNGGDDWTTVSAQQIKLKKFLKQVYNLGVFTTRTNSNYEAIYSGNPNNTTNPSFWETYKNTDYISKEVHPYIWNFVKNISNRLYSSSAVTTAIQNTEYEILANHISNHSANKYKNVTGNILDQYRLSENFVDSSGYVTRYEHRNHDKLEKTQSYDGIIYPQFGYELIAKNWWGNVETYWDSDPSSSIKQLWYTNQKITLSKSMADKELSCLIDLQNNKDVERSISSSVRASELSCVIDDYCIDRYETAYGVNPHGKHEIIYKENGYPFMRPLFNGDKGMLFINANYEINEDNFKDNTTYSAVSSDSFPRIVISQDGTHILIRTGENKLNSYSVIMSKNQDNEFEKALKLNAEISCDSIIFYDKYFNDTLIKTIDDDFYILVPKYDASISAFNNYLFYIKKTGEIKALKETFKGESENEIFKSGLFLNNSQSTGKKILVNTYYVNTDQTLPIDSEVSAVYKDKDKSSGNHKTSYDNWNVSNSSFDVLNQFIQMYVSKPYEKSDTHTPFINIPLNEDDELSAKPSVDLRLETIDSLVSAYQTEVSIENGCFKNETNDLYTHIECPFARAFNINSDAGFNPIYIGENGKIILENHRKTQLDLTRETGAAFELLGPEIKFDENPTIDSLINEDIYPPNASDNDIAFERIHECYSFEDDFEELSQSFDISGETRKTSYRYGYASVVENEEYKDDIYRIKNVIVRDLNVFDNDENPTCVKTNKSLRIDDPDEGYDYNRIFIFLGVGNRLYSLIPRKQKTGLQNWNDSNIEFNAIRGGGQYSIKFKETYVFNEIKFTGSQNYRYVEVYGNARELINAKIYLVHVMGKNDASVIKEQKLIDRTTQTKYNLRQVEASGSPALALVESENSSSSSDYFTLKGSNKKFYNVFVDDGRLFIEDTNNQADRRSAFDNFKIKNNTTQKYSYKLDVINVDNTPRLVMTSIQTEDNIYTPNFMLPSQELAKSLTNDLTDDMIDNHMRAPHVKYIESYQNVSRATTDTDHEILDSSKTNCGSLVFSLTEVDSDLMNMQIPDQWKAHTPPKTVTTEAINGCLRYQDMVDESNPKTFDILDYAFQPFEIIDLDLKREESSIASGIDERDNAVDIQYIIQPYEGSVTVSKDSVNKYTVSFWRRQETTPTPSNYYNDNRLPTKVKATDYAYFNDSLETERPVYGQEHESLNPYINDAGFVPKLMVQWEYNGDTSDSEINLRFNNASAGDSSFINTEAGLEYKSLSTYKDSIIVKPRESAYIDIVAPNHIQVGRTVFYNIPIMRALVTNISDNKPKFMLTILNDKTNSKVTLGYNNYALVFMTASSPETDNSNVVYTTCYVAPMVSSNQTTPPSVSNAIALSELSFNFDIANVLNIMNKVDEETGISELTNNNLLVERINVITPQNTISESAKSCISISNDIHQIRISEPFSSNTPTGFVTVDMKINLDNLSKLNLKNAMLTAHGNVIVYDKDGRTIPIVRVFGCSLNKIGAKHVLTVLDDKGKTNILTVTQSSDRTTAIQVNETSTEGNYNDSDE